MPGKIFILRFIVLVLASSSIRVKFKFKNTSQKLVLVRNLTQPLKKPPVAAVAKSLHESGWTRAAALAGWSDWQQQQPDEPGASTRSRPSSSSKDPMEPLQPVTVELSTQRGTPFSKRFLDNMHWALTVACPKCGDLLGVILTEALDDPNKVELLTGRGPVNAVIHVIDMIADQSWLGDNQSSPSHSGMFPRLRDVFTRVATVVLDFASKEILFERSECAPDYKNFFKNLAMSIQCLWSIGVALLYSTHVKWIVGDSPRELLAIMGSILKDIYKGTVEVRKAVLAADEGISSRVAVEERERPSIATPVARLITHIGRLASYVGLGLTVGSTAATIWNAGTKVLVEIMPKLYATWVGTEGTEEPKPSPSEWFGYLKKVNAEDEAVKKEAREWIEKHYQPLPQPGPDVDLRWKKDIQWSSFHSFRRSTELGKACVDRVRVLGPQGHLGNEGHVLEFLKNHTFTYLAPSQWWMPEVTMGNVLTNFLLMTWTDVVANKQEPYWQQLKPRWDTAYRNLEHREPIGTNPAPEDEQKRLCKVAKMVCANIKLVNVTGERWVASEHEGETKIDNNEMFSLFAPPDYDCNPASETSSELSDEESIVLKLKSPPEA